MLRIVLLFSLIWLLINKIASNHSKDMRNAQENRKQNRPPIMTPPRPPGYKKKTGRDDGYYEPYWENGDWVFYRKSSTNIPRGFFLNTGSTKHSECNQICLQIYQDYGIVCGMRYNRHKWTHEFQTFDNMCHLELANCVSDTQHWYPVKRGNCTEGITTHPTDPSEIATRKLMWEKRFP